MLEDQDRGFAGHTRDLAKNEFVGNQVAKYGNGHFGKRLDNLPQAFGLFRMLTHVA